MVSRSRQKICAAALPKLQLLNSFVYTRKMQEERTYGIVLRSLDYRDGQRIITLFSPLGLISLIVKRIQRRSSYLLTLTTLFCEGEFLFKRGRSELYSFVDGGVIDAHLPLRAQLPFLQTAGALAKTILSSHDLYQLFHCYLKTIPSFATPAALLASFQLKLLSHEGLLCLTPLCNQCHDQPSRHLSAGESLCSAHAGVYSLAFSQEEWSELLALSNATRLSLLRTLSPSPALLQKVDFFFTTTMKSC
jgi:DNA repair protein RecO (recombination protein O)